MSADLNMKNGKFETIKGGSLMNYNETIELEKNIKIKNTVNDLYNDFLTYITLNVENFKFEDARFLIWSDSNNATYLKINSDYFTFECRYLHENYNVNVTPEYLFEYLKRDYKGYSHFAAFVSKEKQKFINKLKLEK